MKYLYTILHKFTLLLLVMVGISIITTNADSQSFYNNGANIKIDSGAVIYIGGNFINNSDPGTNDGTINSYGKMIVEGDWENDANNAVFPVSGGDVIMDGEAQQSIKGSSNTTFANLIFQNADKILENNNNSVSDTLTLDAVLNLNSNTFIIDNPNPWAINYQSNYILSETPPGSYGQLQWNIGSNQSKYSVPFGSGLSNDNDLNLTLTTNTPGDPASGYITFATYPSDAFNNPLPTGVTLLGEPASLIADRFWIIAPGYTTNPGVDILFKYTPKDINTTNNPPLLAKYLRGESFCLACDNGWKVTGASQSNPANNTVLVSGVNGTDFNSAWRLDMPLQEFTIYMPNAFTPGSDGLNDNFGPIGDSLNLVNNYKLLIFNKWGALIFESNNVNVQWDGRDHVGSSIIPHYPNGSKSQEGVYVWEIYYTKLDGTTISQRGTVTLLRNGK